MKKGIILFLFLIGGLFFLSGCEKKEGIEQIFCYECTTYSSVYYNQSTYCNMSQSEALEFEVSNTGYYNGEYVRTVCVQQQ